MKNRRRVLALLTAFSLILTMFSFAPVPVSADQFNIGEELEDVVFQVYAQDLTDYSWHVYDEVHPTYYAPMTISFTQDPTERFSELGASIAFGFNFEDSALQVGQSATVHFVIKDIKLTFAGMPEFTGVEDIDKTANLLCKEATYGKTGNSVAVSLRESIRRAYPDMPLAGLVKSLVSVSCTFQLLSYERGEWAGPQNPDGSEFRGRDEILADMGAGVSVTNALDKENCTGDEITHEMIDAYANMGYTSLYIPVNYDNHLNADMTIDETFLDKIKSTIDYAISKNFYVILSMTGSGDWLSPLPELRSATDSRLTKMYLSIATTMDSFGDHLVIEAIHRPVATKEPTVDPEAEEPAAPLTIDDYNTVLTAWYDKIQRVIRGTGVNNTLRTILFAPYNGDYTLIGNMNFAEVTNLAVSVSFDPYEDTTWDSVVAAGILKDQIATAAREAMSKKNAGCVITSFGALDKNNYETRVQYAYDFTNGARESGISAFWSDNGNTSETGLISFADASYVYPIIGMAQAAAAHAQAKPPMNAQIETASPETQAPETEKSTEGEKTTEAEQTSQAPTTEKEKGGINTTVIILIVVLVVIIVAVVVLALMFKKKNGSLF
ncbi:MAG: cellulase family glycosylhydrolase [Lachnospiraceae bacterium]|nr:cellulase family glycosylhydrolase [Lachnospiraceae bacterium]